MRGRRFHLTFPGHLIDEPLIYRLGRDLGVSTNIRRANVEELGAWVILEIGGSDVDVERALRWLVEQGVDVDRIEG